MTSPICLRLRRGTPEFAALVKAWNQGIDARLEAIVASTADHCGSILEVNVGARDLPVLRRRLRELQDVPASNTQSRAAHALLVTLNRRQMLPEMTPFLASYIKTALWITTAHGYTKDENDDRSFEDHGLGPEHLAPKTLARFAEDCARFLQENEADIAAGPVEGSTESTNEERAAHDFLLTRNRSGCGFWDGDWPEPAATRLTESAQGFGEQDLYWYRGKIHIT